MKHFNIFILLWLGVCRLVCAHDFESATIPPAITINDNKSTLSLSVNYFKDGKQSLCWNWRQNNAALEFSDSDIKKSVESFNNRSGIKLWIWNENPCQQPLVFNFKDENGQIQYTFILFEFYGWRAC